MFYLYVLFSERSGRYYVGHTSDPERRLMEHNTCEELKYTSKFRPWVLMLAFEVSESRGKAIMVEKFIKKQKSKSFLKSLIDSKDNPEIFRQLIAKVVG